MLSNHRLPFAIIHERESKLSKIYTCARKMNLCTSVKILAYFFQPVLQLNAYHDYHFGLAPGSLYLSLRFQGDISYGKVRKSALRPERSKTSCVFPLVCFLTK